MRVALHVGSLPRELFGLVEFVLVERDGIVRRLQRDVRQRRRKVQEERLILVRRDPLHSFVAHHVGAVVLALDDLRPAAFEIDPLIVLPDVIRVMVVRDALAVVAEEKVEALFGGSPLDPTGPSPHLPMHAVA